MGYLNRGIGYPMIFVRILLNFGVLLAISSEEDEKLLREEENESTVTFFNRPFKLSAAMENITKGLTGNYITKTQLMKDRVCLKNLWLIKEKWDLYWVAHRAHYTGDYLNCDKGCCQVELEKNSDELMASREVGSEKFYGEFKGFLKTYINEYLKTYHGLFKRCAEVLKDSDGLEYLEKYLRYLEHLEKYIVHFKEYLEKDKKERVDCDQEGLDTLRSFIRGCKDKGFFKGFEKQLENLERDFVNRETNHLKIRDLENIREYITHFENDITCFKNLFSAKKFFDKHKEHFKKHNGYTTTLEAVKRWGENPNIKQSEKQNFEQVKKWIMDQIDRQTERYFLLYHCRITSSSKENINQFFFPIKIKEAIEKEISNLEEFLYDILSRKNGIEYLEKECSVQGQKYQNLSNTARVAKKECEELKQKIQVYLKAFKEEMLVLRGIQKRMDMIPEKYSGRMV